jgi:hypothetical protein
MKSIVSQIILTSFSSKVDGSLGFRGCTPELSTAEKVAMMDLQGKNCRALFEPIDFATDGKLEIKNPLDSKTPGQRLRGVLFVLHKQLLEKGKMDVNFDVFYTQQLETIITNYKEQLEPEI